MTTSQKFIIIITLIGIASVPLPSFTADNSSSTHEGEMNQSRQLNDQALKLFKKGKILEAISIWEEASKIAIDPKVQLTSNAEVLNNLGFAYYKLGSIYYPKAIEYLQSALVIDPNRWTIYLNLGDLYKAINQRALAVENYKKVLELNPNYKYANKLKADIKEFNAKYVKKMKAKEPTPGTSATTITAAEAEKNLTAREFSFRIHASFHEYRFVLYLDTKGYPRHIDVYRAGDSKAFQRLDVNDGEDINYHCDELYIDNQENLSVIDMNFDGYRDLKLLCGEAMHNTSYMFWLYDKNSGKFTFIPVLTHLSNPEPDTKTITVISDQYTGCAGACRYIRKYKFIGNEFILIDSQETVLGDDGVVRRKKQDEDSER
jgi:tetratricopeptide (TPR) repeat protein